MVDYRDSTVCLMQFEYSLHFLNLLLPRKFHNVEEILSETGDKQISSLQAVVDSSSDLHKSTNCPFRSKYQKNQIYSFSLPMRVNIVHFLGPFSPPAASTINLCLYVHGSKKLTPRFNYTEYNKPTFGIYLNAFQAQNIQNQNQICGCCTSPHIIEIVLCIDIILINHGD